MYLFSRKKYQISECDEYFFFTEYRIPNSIRLDKRPNTEYRIVFGLTKDRIPNSNSIRFLNYPNTEYRIVLFGPTIRIVFEYQTICHTLLWTFLYNLNHFEQCGTFCDNFALHLTILDHFGPF